MEWVETTAKTTAEAKDLALDQLGVDEDDAEFDILEEPRPGLFGRLRGQARVRARVRPTRPRPKAERRDRRRRKDEGTATSPDPEPVDEPATAATAARESSAAGNGGGSPTDGADAGTPSTRTTAGRGRAAKEAPAEGGASESSEATSLSDASAEEGRAAVAFLDELVRTFGLQAESSVVPIAEDEVEVQLDGDDLGLLIGPRGQTLLAVQDLTRLAVQPRDGERHTRLRIDIGGYRQRRRDALVRFTQQVAREVIDSGAPRALEPMSSADRKIVHDTANDLAGVVTVSEGEEPFRRVVIQPGD